MSLITQRVQDTLDRMYQTIEFSDRLLRHASPPQILVFKTLLETRFQALLSTVPDPNLAKTATSGGDVEFVSNYSAMQVSQWGWLSSNFCFSRKVWPFDTFI